MNALELADAMDTKGFRYREVKAAVIMLRQQQERLTKYELRHIVQRDRISILEAQLKKASEK